jgi:hypothetical protein
MKVVLCSIGSLDFFIKKIALFIKYVSTARYFCFLKMRNGCCEKRNLEQSATLRSLTIG